MPDGAGGFSRDSSRPGLLRIPAPASMLPLRDYHPLRRAFPGASGRIRAGPRGSYYPGTALTAPVWAVPLPLAATHGITVVFSSSAYLDVSVRRVRLPASAGISLAGWVAPFGHPRIDPPCGSPRIFAAWHVLLRPVEPRHPPCALLYLLRAVPPFAGHGARRDPFHADRSAARGPPHIRLQHVNELPELICSDRWRITDSNR